MEKYDYAEKIVNALRKALKLYVPCKEILDNCGLPSISIDPSTFCLCSVTFNWWSKIVCTDSGATLCPEYGRSQKILEYDGFDSLLK